MEGTMKNLTFVAHYVRYTITGQVSAGSAHLGSVYTQATSQCIVGVLGGHAGLE